MTFFIFGAGYSGKRIGKLQASAGKKVFGTSRSADKFDTLRNAGMVPLLFDGEDASASIRDALAETTDLVVSIAPTEAGDPVLNCLDQAIERANPKLEWIAYLSTVGVYGDHQGDWVDEASDCRPVSRRSVQRVVAEQAWKCFAEKAGIPLAILRLSGIYGPGRNAFVNLANGTAKRLVKKEQVFNRIHVDDIAGAVQTLARSKTGGVFNVTDDLPAPPQDVVTYAAGLMGREPPPEVPFDSAQLSPMARSFYGENKRVSNARLKAAGYGFQFPDYVTAFDAMWQAGDWAGEGGKDARSPMSA